MKEQTPIERLREEIECSEILSDDTKRILSLIDWNRKIQEEEEFTQSKVLEAQNNLIADIKDKVAKLEENTNTADFAFDVINLLKSIKPL